MAENLTLMEFLRELAGNTGLREWFAHDPQGALHQHGLDDLSPADVHDALVLVQDNQTVDFSRDYGSGAVGDHDATAFGSGDVGGASAFASGGSAATDAWTGNAVDEDFTGPGHTHVEASDHDLRYDGGEHATDGSLDDATNHDVTNHDVTNHGDTNHGDTDGQHAGGVDPH
jgi:hypothetical protein